MTNPERVVPGHVLRYRAGTLGLGRLGVADGPPGWSCSCGGWTLAAVAMPLRRAGTNLIEAERSFARHLDAMAGVTTSD